jgi:hypothetical protein
VTAYLLERAWVQGAVHDDVYVEIEDGRFVAVEVARQTKGLSADASAGNPRIHRAPGESTRATFVGYAVGDQESFPHAASVSMAIGGETVLSMDAVAAALSNREIWRICPGDWTGYGASSCPVDLLGPITGAAVNGSVLLYGGEYEDVRCAPTRTGPLPHGRRIVLRPGPHWRTCASDFALVLAADDKGRLRHLDLTLSGP